MLERVKSKITPVQHRRATSPYGLIHSEAYYTQRAMPRRGVIRGL